jgi:hypothetical protein
MGHMQQTLPKIQLLASQAYGPCVRPIIALVGGTRNWRVGNMHAMPDAPRDGPGAVPSVHQWQQHR